MKVLKNWFFQSLLNSYAQVFFSDNKLFAAMLLLITFVDFYTGLFGLVSVLITTSMAYWIGFDQYKIKQGYYGFNSLLVGLGVGIYFQPGLLLILIVMLAAILTLFISVALEGIIGKYALPHLSLPFVLALWAIMLASREFQALGLSERGIYTLNELYILGGHTLVRIYEWWGEIPFPPSVRSYFLSLGAILFQFNVFTGVLVAIGLMIYSRIAFTLSLLGFYTAFLFYQMIGASFSEVGYSYIGFNYILSAIAIGGYFIIPNRSSYLWVILLIPLVAILTISLGSILWVYQLPILSLPFNIMALLFLYVLKFRLHNHVSLNTLFVQQNSPEKNLYAFLNHMERFGKDSPIAMHLPFFGEWTVTQGHHGKYTHKGDWQHAWDFEIMDEEGRTYKNNGDYPEDYFCYNKTFIAPADGIVETIIDGIEDNIIGQKDLEHNWGNTLIIKHSDYLYTKLSHLKKGSFEVTEGQKIKRGDTIARCGNSGLSPYPHLHFQVQATPHVGSKTIDYPISNYLLKQQDNFELQTVNVPLLNQTVSNIQPHPALKKAFHFIPGEQIHLRVREVGRDEETQGQALSAEHRALRKSGLVGENPCVCPEAVRDEETQGQALSTEHRALRKSGLVGENPCVCPEGRKDEKEVIWEIKRDAYLNTFIECEKTGCKAWFRADGTMLCFTHFEGQRDSILYYFYLGAFKICFGNYKGFEISDSFPLNKVFTRRSLFLQDFIAPFYRYKKATYNLQYLTVKESFSDTKLQLRSEVVKQTLKSKQSLITVEFHIDRSGLHTFHVSSENHLIKVRCLEAKPSF